MISQFLKKVRKWSSNSHLIVSPPPPPQVGWVSACVDPWVGSGGECGVPDGPFTAAADGQPQSLCPHARGGPGYDVFPSPSYTYAKKNMSTHVLFMSESLIIQTGSNYIRTQNIEGLQKLGKYQQDRVNILHWIWYTSLFTFLSSPAGEGGGGVHTAQYTPFDAPPFCHITDFRCGVVEKVLKCVSSAGLGFQTFHLDRMEAVSLTG